METVCSAEREKTIGFLRNVSSADDVDIIIALGMAKEGFDWSYCEHALIVGYREVEEVREHLVADYRYDTVLQQLVMLQTDAEQ